MTSEVLVAYACEGCGTSLEWTIVVTTGHEAVVLAPPCAICGGKLVQQARGRLRVIEGGRGPDNAS